MIELRNISVRSGPFELRNISLSIPAGFYAVLMGRTGSGKTTLLEAICGLKSVREGSIHLSGKDITHQSPAEREIGYVPQDLALFPTMSVREHLEFALRLRNVRGTALRKRVDELAQLLHIESLLSRGVAQLSGGEAQRVALGRALSFHPSVLLLDEPLSALDEETRSHIQQLLKNIKLATGVTVLHVTHSREEASVLADRIYLLDNGQLEMEETRTKEAGPGILKTPRQG